AVLCFCTQAVSLPVRAQDFPNLPPLDRSEIALAEKPGGPMGPAIILYYAVDTDNTKSTETFSMRIKVLNEEGKKYADVEIPYLEKYSQVEEMRGRTIAPDGGVTNFNDQVYDRNIVKARKFRYHAKVLTLPNVQAGSILEYTYRVHFKGKI